MARANLASLTTIRTAAILTTGAVDSSIVAVPDVCTNERIGLFVTFVLGSLTNVVLDPQVSPDGTNWFSVGANPGTITLTAGATAYYEIPVAGATQLKVVATGSGTVTSSSLALKACWIASVPQV